MATLAELRQKAKGMGIAATVIRSAENAAELQGIIDSHNGGGSKKAAKKAVKAVAKKKSSTKAPAKKAAVAKKKSTTKTNSKAASSKKSPAKSTTAKRTSTAKASAPKDSGRYTLEGVDYNDTDGWNARDGSAPDRIVKALRRFKGNREKVFDFLVGDVWDFAGKRKRDGSKRTKAEAEKMLRYRIARTDWDFALATDQHEKSPNRVEYGTGGTGQGIFKRAKKGKASAAKAPAKRGRPAKKAAAKPAAKRGRPKGSTNKPKGKAAARKAGAAAAKRKR